MDKSVKWFLGITLPILLGISSWNAQQNYEQHATSSAHEMSIVILKENQTLYQELAAEKNKNCNIRIDKIVDNQGLINTQNSKEYQSISKKLDKVNYYLQIQSRDFREYMKLTAENTDTY